MTWVHSYNKSTCSCVILLSSKCVCVAMASIGRVRNHHLCCIQICPAACINCVYGLRLLYIHDPVALSQSVCMVHITCTFHNSVDSILKLVFA